MSSRSFRVLHVIIYTLAITACLYSYIITLELDKVDVENQQLRLQLIQCSDEKLERMIREFRATETLDDCHTLVDQLLHELTIKNTEIRAITDTEEKRF